MKSKKIYYVSFIVVGEQCVEVEAHNKKEAKEKARNHEASPVDFNVLYNKWSTMKVRENKYEN